MKIQRLLSILLIGFFLTLIMIPDDIEARGGGKLMKFGKRIFVSRPKSRLTVTKSGNGRSNRRYEDVNGDHQ